MVIVVAQRQATEQKVMEDDFEPAPEPVAIKGKQNKSLEE
jgi:hypothetical protein